MVVEWLNAHRSHSKGRRPHFDFHYLVDELSRLVPGGEALRALHTKPGKCV